MSINVRDSSYETRDSDHREVEGEEFGVIVFWM